ncbi:hypothetical protein [Flavobacterium sp. ov086]|uniref:hypothetical protein n=1 Tax=Flavobacterium sp. ov086 TaxID=1761785 RepID=UPI000B683F34|nr:hypothetical protein [Flavobacterium sp. ov086]SNR29740.1 hypothetical protein SAMN04487979_10266 [Flavobacterium sp. ov086]
MKNISKIKLGTNQQIAFSEIQNLAFLITYPLLFVFKPEVSFHWWQPKKYTTTLRTAA